MVCAVGADGEVRTAGGMSKMQVYPMFNVRFQQTFILINAFSVLTFKVLVALSGTSYVQLPHCSFSFSVNAFREES